MPLIDGHTHIFAPGQITRREALCERDATFAEIYGDPGAKMSDAPALLAALDEAGIEAAVVAGFAFADERDIDEQNEYILGAAGESQGRLIPLATINAARSNSLEVLDRALAAGARGVGELRPHNQGWDPAGETATRLLASAADAGAVLLWHVSEPVGHEYPGKAGGIRPHELARVAEAVPALRMVGAHMGGGLPFFLQMPELRVALANVYFDTAAFPLLYDDQSVARLVDLTGPGRVIFGSDYPLLSPRRQLERILPLLPPEAVRAVCGDTAGSLFRDIHEE